MKLKICKPLYIIFSILCYMLLHVKTLYLVMCMINTLVCEGICVKTGRFISFKSTAN